MELISQEIGWGYDGSPTQDKILGTQQRDSFSNCKYFQGLRQRSQSVCCRKSCKEEVRTVQSPPEANVSSSSRSNPDPCL